MGHVEELLRGNGQIISFPGTSQYSQGSNSGCGLAAFNCARTLLGWDMQGMSPDQILWKMGEKKTMEVCSCISQRAATDSSTLMQDIVSICATANIPRHMEAEDYQSLPLFQSTIKLEHLEFCTTNGKMITELLRCIDPLHHCSIELRSLPRKLDDFGQGPRRRACAVIITRPPEILVCLKIAHQFRDIYVLFDSHSRPRHPHGAAFFCTPSFQGLATYLNDLLHVDPSLLDPSNELQWEAQLLGSMSGHYFLAAESALAISQETLEILMGATLKLLESHAAVAEIGTLRSQIAERDAAIRQLRTQVETIELDRSRMTSEIADHRETMTRLRRERAELREENMALHQMTGRGSSSSSGPSFFSRATNFLGRGTGSVKIPVNVMPERDLIGEHFHVAEITQPQSRFTEELPDPRTPGSSARPYPSQEDRGAALNTGVSISVQPESTSHSSQGHEGGIDQALRRSLTPLDAGQALHNTSPAIRSFSPLTRRTEYPGTGSDVTSGPGTLNDYGAGGPAIRPFGAAANAPSRPPMGPSRSSSMPSSNVHTGSETGQWVPTFHSEPISVRDTKDRATLSSTGVGHRMASSAQRPDSPGTRPLPPSQPHPSMPSSNVHASETDHWVPTFHSEPIGVRDTKDRATPPAGTAMVHRIPSSARRPNSPGTRPSQPYPGAAARTSADASDPNDKRLSYMPSPSYNEGIGSSHTGYNFAPPTLGGKCPPPVPPRPSQYSSHPLSKTSGTPGSGISAQMQNAGPQFAANVGPSQGGSGTPGESTADGWTIVNFREQNGQSQLRQVAAPTSPIINRAVDDSSDLHYQGKAEEDPAYTTFKQQQFEESRARADLGSGNRSLPSIPNAQGSASGSATYSPRPTAHPSYGAPRENDLPQTSNYTTTSHPAPSIEEQLAAEHRGLIANAGAKFSCLVCHESHQDVDITRIDPCGHKFGTTCLSSYINSRTERPIACPACPPPEGHRESPARSGE